MIPLWELKYYGNIDANDYGQGDVYEVGIYDNGTDKTLYMRATHSKVTIGATTVVDYEITFVYSAE